MAQQECCKVVWLMDTNGMSSYPSLTVSTQRFRVLRSALGKPTCSSDIVLTQPRLNPRTPKVRRARSAPASKLELERNLAISQMVLWHSQRQTKCYGWANPWPLFLLCHIAHTLVPVLIQLRNDSEKRRWWYGKCAGSLCKRWKHQLGSLGHIFKSNFLLSAA